MFLLATVLSGNGAVLPPLKTTDSDLITALLNAPTAVDRIKLIKNDSDFMYDFQNPPFQDAIRTGKGTLISLCPTHIHTQNVTIVY
jgi:hypothetical protein